MLNDEQMLLIAMCLVPEPSADNVTLRTIRNEFMKRDRPYHDLDVVVEYRRRYADTIIERWRRAVHR